MTLVENTYTHIAAENDLKAYLSGDTLFYNQDYQIMPAKKIKKAAYYGVVKDIDDENIATIAVYDKKDQTLLALLKRIASGNEFGAKKGEQCYYYPDGTIKEKDVYDLFHNDKNGYTISLPVSETLMYPDGVKQEEVTISYKGSKREETYEREGYFPNGNLQFREAKEGKDAYSLTFYDETGKVAKNGKIEDVRVVRSGGHPLLDKEAVRVLRSMPKWIPGKKRGEPVRVKYTVPVNFALE